LLPDSRALDFIDATFRQLSDRRGEHIQTFSQLRFLDRRRLTGAGEAVRGDLGETFTEAAAEDESVRLSERPQSDEGVPPG